MLKITVNKLGTSNTTPTITGTVEFERIKTVGNTVKTQTINVIVNYNRYKLFDGNLGLDESKTPNVWKLHFDNPLYPGVYDVEAQIIDVENNLVLASDESSNGLTIFRTYPTIATNPSGGNLSLLQKLAVVQGLMNSMNRLFGGSSGIGQNPSVHPAQDDQISTHLGGRGAQERNEHPTVKDKDKRQKKMTVPYPVPRPEEFKVTKSGGAADALAKAKEALGGGSGLDATVDPGDAAWNSKVDDTEKTLADAKASGDASEIAGYQAGNENVSAATSSRDQNLAIAAGATSGQTVTISGQSGTRTVTVR